MRKADMVRADMIAAMKMGDKNKRIDLSFLLNSLQMAEKNKLSPLTEEEENAVILKEVNNIKETLRLTPADRIELLDRNHAILDLYLDYMPRLMDKAEIHSIVVQTIKDLHLDDLSMKSKGIVMKALMPKVKGKSDGKMVSEIVDTTLKNYPYGNWSE